MADIIRLLPDSVANQIAAGEVIQRPASAVKELLENAVDSGAGEIKLIIKDAGKSLIQVVDNGCGMSHIDARMAFERHATSKISKADDLFAIKTLGFRGEALASIAAIAQVEVKTRLHEDELGTCIIVEGSKVKSQNPCQCPPGTSILVKNLFFNIPARRNFLKSNTSELKHIIDEFFRVALVYKDIRFSFHNNNELLHQLPPSGIKQRIVNLFGKGYSEKIIPLEHVTSDLRMTGFIGKPEFAKKTRGEQFFFVNGRFIKHAYLNHSINSAFQELLPKDSFPTYFVYIEVDPKVIDINIHPTKTELNFQDAQLIYAALRSAVRQALGMHNVIPSIDFDTERSLDFNPPGRDRVPENPFERPKKPYNPFETSDIPPERKKSFQQKINIENWEKLYQSSGDEGDKDDRSSFLIDPDWKKDEGDEEKGNIFQLQNRFIITNVKSAIVIIDQHKAHLRILYEKYLETLKDSKPVIQSELFPENIIFSGSDVAVIDELVPELELLGFSLNKLSNTTFVVDGTPSGLKSGNIQEIFEGILDNYKKNLLELNLDKKINLARSLAANLAIRPGKKLHQEEIMKIVDELFACKVPEVTPDGDRIYAIVGVSDIQNLLES